MIHTVEIYICEGDQVIRMAQDNVFVHAWCQRKQVHICSYILTISEQSTSQSYFSTSYEDSRAMNTANVIMNNVVSMSTCSMLIYNIGSTSRFMELTDKGLIA